MQKTGLLYVDKGILFIFDFWISDKMKNVSAYTEWWNKQYLIKFPKPLRKENVWKQSDVEPYHFTILNQVNYSIPYEMDKDAFIHFMLLQSNVIAQAEEKGKNIAIFKSWFEDSLEPIFNHKKQTLIFDVYSWYLKLIKENRNEKE